MNRGTVKPALPRSATPDVLIGGLPPGLATALGQITALAAARAARLWLVGGVVRDLLLGAPLGRDVDLAVEGDVAALAVVLAAALGGRVLARHDAFGTASLALPCADLPDGEIVLDLARARVESYPQPTALPVVQPAAIGEDLGRRDFSVNAIAVELLADDGHVRAGALLDPHDGRGDLAAGWLRLLHPHSLRDDPTRLLRGLRLAARLGLRPDEATAAQIADALAQGYLSILTPARTLGEICLALEEPRPDDVLALADAWGVTAQIAPGLGWSEPLAARLARRREGSVLAIGYRLSAIHAALLCYDLPPGDLAALAGRYPLPAPFARLLAEIPSLRESARALVADLRPSEIDLLLRPYSEVAISVLHYAEAGVAGDIAARYLGEIRPARPPLDGRDMQRLGVAPGPAIGRMLGALRAAYLDGEAQTCEDAEQWVRAAM